MSLRRTPPKSSNTKAQKENVILQDSDTAPEQVYSDSDLVNSQHVSRRIKRKHGDETITELKQLLCEMQRKQDAEFASLKEDTGTIKKHNEEFQKSLEFLSEKYDSLLVKLDRVEKENAGFKDRIQDLENKIDQLERGTKSSSAEIRNIPLIQSETKATLCTYMQQLAAVVTQPMQNNEIRDIYRIKTKSEPGPIIVEFTSASTKENLIKSVINFNKGKSPDHKINTSHLQMNGKPKPIYISDNLTAKTRRLFYIAREFAKINNYNKCWTAYGKVYLRQREGQPIIRIDNENNLSNLNVKK